MDHLKKLTHQIQFHIFFVVLLSNAILIAGWIIGSQKFDIDNQTLMITLGGVALVVALLISSLSTQYLIQPIKILWQAILHVSPGKSESPAPNLKTIKLGRELLTTLCLEVYQLASNIGNPKDAANDSSTNRAKMVLNKLPMPLFVMDKDQNFVLINDAAKKYLNAPDNTLIGKNMYEVLDLSFPSDNTYDKWLEKSRTSSAITNGSWEHVRLQLKEPEILKQFDMAANYTKNSPTGVETMITIFDRTKYYADQDQAVGFISLAVHELRNPLTMLPAILTCSKKSLMAN